MYIVGPEYDPYLFNRFSRRLTRVYLLKRSASAKVNMADQAVWLFASLLTDELLFHHVLAVYQLKAAQSDQAGSPPADSAVEKSSLACRTATNRRSPAARKECALGKFPPCCLKEDYFYIVMFALQHEAFLLKKGLH